MLRVLRDNRGAAAIEFGIIAPIVAAVLVAIATSGGLILAHNKMRQAVSAGAQYVLTAGAADEDAIEDVVIAAWSGMPEDGDVEVEKTCVCSDGEAECDAICEDGDYPEKATLITATASYTDFGGATRTITADQEVRTW